MMPSVSFHHHFMACLLFVSSQICFSRYCHFCEAFVRLSSKHDVKARTTTQLQVLVDRYTTNESWMQHSFNLVPEVEKEKPSQQQSYHSNDPNNSNNPVGEHEQIPISVPDPVQIPQYEYPTNESWQQRTYNLPEQHLSPPLPTTTTGTEVVQHQISDSAQQQQIEVGTLAGKRGTLRPPEPLYSMPIGSSIRAYRRVSETGSDDFHVVKVCQDPPIFVLRNLLSPEDCERIQQEAASLTMGPAETVTKGDFQSRKYCKVAWIQEVASGPPLVLPLARGLANLFISEEIRNDPGSGIEDLQVLHYETGGEYVLHHDSETRALTIIYYLNGNAGTWFPLAGSKVPRPLHKVQAMRLCQSLYPHYNGICIGGDRLPINAGDAVAFYNYLDDGSGMLNWRAIHTGLPAKGSKWIANHWFRSSGIERGY